MQIGIDWKWNWRCKYFYILCSMVSVFSEFVANIYLVNTWMFTPFYQAWRSGTEKIFCLPYRYLYQPSFMCCSDRAVRSSCTKPYFTKLISVSLSQVVLINYKQNSLHRPLTFPRLSQWDRVNSLDAMLPFILAMVSCLELSAKHECTRSPFRTRYHPMASIYIFFLFKRVFH